MEGIEKILFEFIDTCYKHYKKNKDYNNGLFEFRVMNTDKKDIRYLLMSKSNKIGQDDSVWFIKLSQNGRVLYKIKPFYNYVKLDLPKLVILIKQISVKYNLSNTINNQANELLN